MGDPFATERNCAVQIRRYQVFAISVVTSLLLGASCGGSGEDDPAGAGGSGAGGAAGAGGRPDSGAGATGAGGATGGAGGSGGSAGSSAKGGSAGVGGGGGPNDGGGGVKDGGAGNGGTAGAAGSGAGGASGSGGSAGARDGSSDVNDGRGGAAGSDAGGGAGKGGSGGSSSGDASSDADARSDSAGASGAGGAAGAGGGKADSGPSNCPTALAGWATISGDGVTTTTGGGNATPVRPTTAAELQNYASDSTPRVIEIAGTFAVPSLEVASNKTIVGIGNNAVINGGISIRGKSDALVQNVILRNIKVNGATTGVDYDAVQIYFAHHVWIDHCEIWDGPDGNLDMSHAVNWVTVSWTKFRYTTSYQRPPGETSDHRFSSLIGHSDDNASEDSGRLKVTFHHNWWAERVIERMPRVRFGQVHIFNNYFSSAGNNYCVRAGTNAHLLVEGNYFDGVGNPHEFNDSTDQMTASITARNNTYSGTSGNQSTGGGGAPFTTPPYSATIESAGGIPALVQGCAGPR